MSKIGSSGRPVKPPTIEPKPADVAKSDSVKSKKEEEPITGQAASPPASPKLTESGPKVKGSTRNLRASTVQAELAQSLPPTPDSSRSGGPHLQRRDGKQDPGYRPPLEKRAAQMDLKASLPGLGHAAGQDVGAAKLGGKATEGIQELSARETDPKKVQKDIQRKYGDEVAKDFKTARKGAKADIHTLEKKDKEKPLEINEKAELERLKKLDKAFEDDPYTIAKHMSDNRRDLTYQFMGPKNFAALEVTTRDLVAQNEKVRGKSYDLSTMQRVAIFGYTTKDYETLNPALREAKGTPLQEPKLRSYVDHINKGLDQLDDFKPAQDQKLYRFMRSDKLPAHIYANYKPGGKVQDYAFTSTSVNPGVLDLGDVKISIGNTAGKGGKILPFSAFPGEQEVLFRTGTGFDVQGKTPLVHPEEAKWRNMTPEEYIASPSYKKFDLTVW